MTGTPRDQDPFHRIRLMLGEDRMLRLSDAFVAVIGLGAVGGYAVEALARSGIGRFRLVDFDEICPTNINRQILALRSTIGRPKCEVARERVLDINPQCKVEAMQVFARADTFDMILEGNPDLVIDCIDSRNPKLELLSTMRRREVRLISSMGAALRTDPSKVRTGLLEKVTYCPLAAQLRKKLRKRGVPLDIPCVYSEEPVGKLKDNAIIQNQQVDREHRPQGRVRSTLGSLPTLTGIFGLTVANLAIDMLVDGLDLGQFDSRKQ